MGKIIEAIGRHTWNREGSRRNPVQLRSNPHSQHEEVQRAAQLARERLFPVHMQLRSRDRFTVSYRRGTFRVKPRGELTYWMSGDAQRTQVGLNAQEVKRRSA